MALTAPPAPKIEDLHSVTYGTKLLSRLHKGQSVSFFIGGLLYTGVFQSYDPTTGTVVLDDPFERNFIAASAIEAVQLETECGNAIDCSRRSKERHGRSTLFSDILRKLVGTTVDLQFGSTIVEGVITRVSKRFVVLRSGSCTFTKVALKKVVVILVPLSSTNTLGFGTPISLTLVNRSGLPQPPVVFQ